MKRILALAAALLALGAPLATAQQAVVTSPTPRVTTNASSTIAVTNTFQQIWPAQTARVNCGIQNNDTNTMWVYFGSGTATKATSVVLAPGQYLNCSTSGIVATSAVSITGTATGVFYAGLDGAPIVLAPTTVVATSSGTATVNCVYNTTLPTYTNGQTSTCQTDARGNLRSYQVIGQLAATDGFLNTNTGFAAGSTSTSATLLQGIANYGFNGTSWDRIRADTNGQYAQGNVASGVADAGNPVKVGCVMSVTAPTFTAGQRADCLASSGGALVTMTGGSSTTGTDGLTNANVVYPVSAVGGASATTARTGLSTAGVMFNGASWDREFTCPNTAVVNVTAAATTQIVALAASQVIRVCSVSISMSAAGTAQFVYGTGANCGTGTTNITGAMPLATGVPMTISSGNGSVMRTASANALCVAAVTGNVVGWVTYAQY